MSYILHFSFYQSRSPMASSKHTKLSNKKILRLHNISAVETKDSNPPSRYHSTSCSYIHSYKNMHSSALSCLSLITVGIRCVLLIRTALSVLPVQTHSSKTSSPYFPYCLTPNDSSLKCSVLLLLLFIAIVIFHSQSYSNMIRDILQPIKINHFN